MRNKKRMLQLGAALAAGAMLLAGCSSAGDSNTSPSGGTEQTAQPTLRLGAITYPNSFDVNGYSDASYVQYFQAVFDTLTRQEPDGTIVPGLATSWAYSEDGSTLTMQLREGVTFTDGAEFNADAVVANIEAFMNSATGNLSYAQSIDSVTKTGDYEVAFALNSPDPRLLDWFSVSLGYMASPASLGTTESATNPVGSGPYILDSANTVVASKYVYKKNPDYWDTSYHVYDNLEIYFYESQAAILNALRANQLDAAPVSDYTATKEIEGAGYTITTNALDWYGLLVPDRNGDVVPALADVRVRQAMNYAMDREAWVTAVNNGYATPSSQYFAPAAAGFDPDLEDYYAYDLDKARELMAEAGYANGFTITMPMLASQQTNMAILESMLKDINITVAWDQITPGDYLGGVFEGKWPVVPFQLFSAHGWAANFVYSEFGMFNTSHVTTDDMRAAMDKLQASTGDEFTAAAAEVNRIGTEEAWMVTISHADSLYVHNNKVGVRTAADSTMPYLYFVQPAS